MQNKKLKTEISELLTLKTVSNAYAEISSIRMGKIRNAVLVNRVFLDSINAIFKDVLASYSYELAENLKSKKKKQKITFLAHNGKTVAVYLSANTGLYGEIVGKTFNMFLRESETPGVEITVVGKLGRTLFEQSRPGVEFSYFDFPDYQISEDAWGKIVGHLVPYQEIDIYYGKYKSVVTQEADVYKITAPSPYEDVVKKTPAKLPPKYIFEPSLDEVMMFFETEIFTSTFEQVLRENQLAKFASRITAMTKASDNISLLLKKRELEHLRLSHYQENKKQINSASYLAFSDGN